MRRAKLSRRRRWIVREAADRPDSSPRCPLQSVHVFYKYEIMSDTELTTLEQHLLLAIIGLHPNAYGASIQEHIKERTGREPSTGSVYAAIDRLPIVSLHTERPDVV